MGIDRVKELVQEGLLRKLSGDVAGAAQAWEEALRLDPDNARARDGLASLRGAEPPAPKGVSAAVGLMLSPSAFGPAEPRKNPFAKPAPATGAPQLTPSPFLSAPDADPGGASVTNPFGQAPLGRQRTEPVPPSKLPFAAPGGFDDDTEPFGAPERGDDVTQPNAPYPQRSPPANSSMTDPFGNPFGEAPFEGWSAPDGPGGGGRVAGFMPTPAPWAVPGGPIPSTAPFGGPANPFASAPAALPRQDTEREPGPPPGALDAAPWDVEIPIEVPVRAPPAPITEREVPVVPAPPRAPAAPPASAPVPDPDSPAALLRRAADQLELDDHTGAHQTLTKLLAAEPGNAKAQEMMRRCEVTLVAMFESKLGDLSRHPVVRMRAEEMVWLNLDHRAGFVLSLIDGQVSFEDLFALSAMSRLDTARILALLVAEKVIG